MSHLTHTQQVLYAWLVVVALLAFAVAWVHFWFMVGRIVRWTYLEKKEAHLARKQARRDEVEVVWAADRVPARWGR
jgi:hypothetical protein